MLELNKIHLGDCYELIKQIPDKSVDCIYTDIPYLIENGGKGNNALSERMFLLRNIDLEDIRHGIDYSIFEEFYRIIKKINVYIWCNKSQIFDIQNIFSKYKTNVEILVWCKSNPSPLTNGVWLPDVEYCLYFREKGVKLNDGYEIKSKWFKSAINKNDKDLFEHPSIKPVELVKRHLLHTTQPNDIVLDCFSGSGTTCVAAKELGRQFIGIEKNTIYHKISVDRLNGICANGQTSIFTDFENEVSTR